MLWFSRRACSQFLAPWRARGMYYPSAALSVCVPENIECLVLDPSVRACFLVEIRGKPDAPESLACRDSNSGKDGVVTRWRIACHPLDIVHVSSFYRR